VRLGAIGRELGDDSRDLLPAFPLDFDVLQAKASTARQCRGIGALRNPHRGRPRRALVGLVRRAGGRERRWGDHALGARCLISSALYGLLDKLRDLGLPLISVRRLLLEEQEAKER
jgi:hypothetical protein